MVGTLVVALLPALVAYRYTSPVQRGEFVSHPWRGWSFIAAALRRARGLRAQDVG